MLEAISSQHDRRIEDSATGEVIKVVTDGENSLLMVFFARTDGLSGVRGSGLWRNTVYSRRLSTGMKIACWSRLIASRLSIVGRIEILFQAVALFLKYKKRLWRG